MRSKVLHVKDHHSVDITPLIEPFVPDEEALQYELKRLANPYIRWQSGGPAAKGDMVTCRLASACRQFNRDSVRFVAGSGMFHQALERLVIGMREGETRAAELPEGLVEMTARSVMNRVVPPLSDGMVEALGLEGVHTLEEYTSYLLQQQREKAQEEDLYPALRQLMRTVIDGSEFVLCKEDWETVVERNLTRCRTLARQEGLELERMTAEEFEGRIPVKSYDGLVVLLQREAWDDLCRYLLGCYYARQDGFQADEVGYQRYLAEYAQRWHTSVEKAQEAVPYDSYLFDEFSGHAYHVLKEFIREQY